VKKLISIGVALAVLAMVVLPIGVAAQCDYEGITPTTYAKIPFTIIGTGLYLMEEILGVLIVGGILPDTLDWLPDLMIPMGDWAMGPLSWTVDMLAWGLGAVGVVVSELDAVLVAMGIDLGDMELAPVGDLFNTIACQLFTPFACNITGAGWNPCT
jgi:hypothetical protein